MSVAAPQTWLAPPPYIPPILSLVTSAPAGPTPQEVAQWQAGRETNAADSWALGGQFRTIACSGEDGDQVFDLCTSLTWGDNETSSLEAVTPFGVVVPERCSPFGFQRAEYWQRALLKHSVRESFLIAREYWTGAVEPGNFHLATSGTAVDITPGTTPKPHDALGRLDEALNECLKGAMGAIHMSIGLFNDIATANGLVKVGDPLGTTIKGFTHAGTLIIADAGYPGTAPDGSGDPGGEIQNMYGTAMPKVYRTAAQTYPAEGQMVQATNRANNMVEVRAQSIAVVTTDPCCLLTIQATRSGVS